jgi:RNA-directed DNA polymerase
VQPELSPSAIRLLSASNRVSLAEALGVKTSFLTRVVYRLPEGQRYAVFAIPKRSGGQRTISAPVPPLRFLQRRVAAILDEVYAPKRNAHGFIKARSIKTNASPHVRARWVFNVDLKDFFPSMNFGRVLGVFRAAPFSLAEPVAVTLAQICCHQGVLPQGAPTSPVMSNLICRSLDRALRSIARSHGCEYTRYADDITMSTRRLSFPSILGSFDHGENGRRAIPGDLLKTTIERSGFVIHPSKVRLLPRRVRQEVTGLVINRKLNVPRSFIRQLRGLLHAWELFGHQAAHAEWATKVDSKHRSRGEGISLARVVGGKLAYLRMVKGEADPVYRRLHIRYARLLGLPTEIAALWVLESDSQSLQATGFFLSEYGFITSQHVIADDLVAFKPEAPLERRKVRAISQDKDLDLAICAIDGVERPFMLRPGTNPLQIGSYVRLLGFPNWAPGSTHSDSSGAVTKLLRYFGADCITISCPIIAGNSGGPLLNNVGEVVAVARKGVIENDQPDHESMAVLIESLRRMKGATGGAS